MARLAGGFGSGFPGVSGGCPSANASATAASGGPYNDSASDAHRRPGWMTYPAELTAFVTHTSTESRLLAPWLSVTTRAKRSSVGWVTVGEVNEALAVLAPVSVTAGPAIWVQA